jgi:hypothetical protein
MKKADRTIEHKIREFISDFLVDGKGTCRCSLTVGYERLIKHSTVDLNSLPTSASKPSAFDLFSWPFFPSSLSRSG